MTRLPLHVAAFGGGVVLEGAADTRKIDEVLQADAIDIGPRGALIATSDVTPYVVLNDGASVPAAWSKLYGLFSMMPGTAFVQMVAIGEGQARVDAFSPYGPAYIVRTFDREGDASPVTGTAADFNLLSTAATLSAPTVPLANGAQVTYVAWPGVFKLPTAGVGLWNLSFLCLGAREGVSPEAVSAFGLWAVGQVVGSLGTFVFPISQFNALGTGTLGDGVTPTDIGTHAQQLFFRGIVAWNDFLFGWGFDSSIGGDAARRAESRHVLEPRDAVEVGE